MSTYRLLSPPPQQLRYLELSGFHPDAMALKNLACPSQLIAGLEFVFGPKGQLMIRKGTSCNHALRRV
jgi:hypothetical protein